MSSVTVVGIQYCLDGTSLNLQLKNQRDKKYTLTKLSNRLTHRHNHHNKKLTKADDKSTKAETYENYVKFCLCCRVLAFIVSIILVLGDSSIDTIILFMMMTWYRYNVMVL
jgi:hypothetical protein